MEGLPMTTKADCDPLSIPVYSETEPELGLTYFGLICGVERLTTGEGLSLIDEFIARLPSGGWHQRGERENIEALHYARGDLLTMFRVACSETPAPPGRPSAKTSHAWPANRPAMTGVSWSRCPGDSAGQWFKDELPFWRWYRAQMGDARGAVGDCYMCVSIL
jgi:hypothetical protein